MDYGCKISDLEVTKNTVILKSLKEGRRMNCGDNYLLKILCFGERAVVSISKELIPFFEEKLENYDANWLFNFPVLRSIDKKLGEFGHEIADIHHYYLPLREIEEVKEITKVRWYEKEEIIKFKGDNRFNEAFAFNEDYPDVLAVAALDGEEIIGMASASRDSEEMWQIGIDVMKDHRGKGIGTNLVSLLKNEIIKRGKIPFYSTIESNIYSQTIAIKTGFIPVFAELYSREK
ncbi:MAG: GNAT family N-acetyltransferase [Clostridium sp.]